MAPHLLALADTLVHVVGKRPRCRLDGDPVSSGGVGVCEKEAHARLEEARRLLEAGMMETATEEYAWLWANIPRAAPSLVGVRVSFMLMDVEELVAEHAPARAWFEHARDRAAASARRASRIGQRVDWIALNRTLGDEDRTIKWFDRVKLDPRYVDMLDRLAFWLMPGFAARGRWADLGRIVREPLRYIRAAHQPLEFWKESPGAGREALSAMRAHFREQCSMLLRCLLAAGRRDAASALQEEACRLDPSAKMKANMLQEMRASERTQGSE